MSAVHAAIALRCSAPEWATFFEVSNAAGWGRSRSADAIAMNLWPSRGLEIHGFEVKVSRADWLRELKDPAKSEPVQRFCDRWWVAVADEAIVKAGELPATWGLLVLRAKKLVQVREAPKLDSEPIDRGFAAAMFRRATEGCVPKSAVADLVEQRLEERVKQERDHNAIGFERATAALEKVTRAVDAFEQASGLRIVDEWRYRATPAQLGAAVSLILGGGVARGYSSKLEQARNIAEEFVREAGDALSALTACSADIRPKNGEAAE